MAASECVKGILECDPDISFMPYFFGIQLLHGSLLLLLVAYRLQADSGAAILAACEAVIRATEACFVTLPTDYQVRACGYCYSHCGNSRPSMSYLNANFKAAPVP